MGAHILSIMNDTISGYHTKTPTEKQIKVDQLKHALSYAMGCDLLDMNDWIILKSLCQSTDPDPLYAIMIFWWKIQDYYIQMHIDLCEPANTEQWIEAKFAKVNKPK